jgi:trk system potassium uptake protein TrkH
VGSSVALLRRPETRGRLGVDVPATLHLVSTFVAYLSAAFLFPVAIALGYGEPVWPFLAALGITLAVGVTVRLLTAGRQRVGLREGFLVVSLTWLVVPVFGAIPYLLAGEPQLSNPMDAYFEAVSGFTATGATVLVDIEALDRSLVMWRQFSQWLGGMGIVVLAIAILPRLRVGGRQLLQSELAGPTEMERLTATIRETARRLWVLYLGLTALMILVLAALGWSGLDDAMTPFDAVAHAFSGVAIGGFSTQNDSIAAFGAATQWAIVAFIAVAGVNFLRLYRVFVQRQPQAVTRDEEFRLYLALLAVGSGLMLLELVTGDIFAGEEAVRHAVVQAVSIMTTTGFASADYTQWSALAGMTLLILMFVGASAGSTGGSIKVVRHLLMLRITRRELEQTVHREVIVPIRLNGAVVDERALRSVVTFIALYLIVLALASVGLVIDARRAAVVGIASFDAIGAAAACLGNVGPAFGFAGPFGSYEPFSDLSTGILTGLMWLGRLEIIPVAVLLTRGYWQR